MKLTRRDLLVWSAGAAAGLVVTPVPWKLLDDVSIWSQNWRWIPQPARGPVEVKRSACALCPQGCGLRVRMAGGWPVGVAGAASHPVTRGALCPLAFGAHQMNWHPRRLQEVRHRASPASWEDARAAFVKACSEGPVVVIDGYPGRAASEVLETFAHKQGGEYRVILGPEARVLGPYEKWSGVSANALGYDLENAQTIVSFGAPLLDGWGTPGRVTRLWAERASGAPDPQLRLLQIEPSLSRTATRAWQWVPIREGSESALAAGLARVLIEDRLVAKRGPIPPGALVEAANQTGLSTDEIRGLARTMVARTPVVVITPDENPAIAALNVVLGAVGTPGGIVQRSKTMKSLIAADSVLSPARAVLLDSSVPWNFESQIEAETFRFAAWDGAWSKTDWLLPAPGFLEELSDFPTAPGSAIETYAVAPSLTNAPHPTHSAAEFLAGTDPSLPSAEQIIHARCSELFRQRAGTLHGEAMTPVAKIESVQKLEEQLRQGAMWIGDPLRHQKLRCDLQEWPAAAPGSAASLSARNWRARWDAPVLPPLATKLYRESSLREAPEGRTA
jgi:Molybdopterin oxidoreductase Fe4S4 domain/Molybdopterin oxidoreductase